MTDAVKHTPEMLAPEHLLVRPELGQDVDGQAEILEHVRKYGTKEGDPRRLYTQSQIELAMRLSVRRALTMESSDV